MICLLILSISIAAGCIGAKNVKGKGCITSVPTCIVQALCLDRESKFNLKFFPLQQTFEFHYGKHHAAYVNNLNNQIAGTDLEKMTIEEVMLKTWNSGSPTPEFNNAAQVVNHTFFWESMGPNKGGEPSGDLAKAIERDFGSFEAFKDAFKAAGATQFGSGWAWLSVGDGGKLEVSKTPNAENPWCHGKTPILTMDVWEHAYYLDVQNRRPDYISTFFELINWDKVAERYAAALA